MIRAAVNYGDRGAAQVGRRGNLPFGDSLRDVHDPGGGANAPLSIQATEPTGLRAWGNTTRTQYARMEKDAPTGLDHTPYRKYDSGWGRSTSPDPYGGSMDARDPQSFNRYAYVSNDPVNRVDPSGLMDEICDADGNCYPWEPPVATAYGGADGLSLFGGYFTPAGQSGSAGLFFAPLRPAPAGEPPIDLEPQNPPPSGNPNCVQNAVVGSPGLGRPFDANPGPNGRVFHDGVHALSPANAANAVTLPALAGEVIYSNVQEKASRGNPALYTVDVRPTNGNFIVTYKDLTSLSFPVGQTGMQLAAGAVIGTVRPAGDPKDYRGLHVTLVNPEFYKAFRQETKAQARQNRLGTFNTRKMFIDPLGPNSPIRCP